MKEKEKMINGELYNANDEELVKDRNNARRLMKIYNNTTPEEGYIRKDVIKELFGKVGNDFYIEPPFACDYGFNIEWGENSYANFDCLILDGAPVKIGKNVLLAPNVKIFTATHPISPQLRKEGKEYAKPVTIGDNVWIGGGTIINPGVTIGENTVIGSGSVVTKDIPANVVAAGNPCRVIKNIEE
ncbi:sugar O-acetyltransferase [Clostridium sp. MSJ-11]|uniref:Acetyltransferase n=1 Tax=Clostridium mobile TaxID=2841512 RepID=A0ABS6EEI7_9CLOT|nr:sugar O-acetyltransferase [Clostridium mobile]MBU5483631.1 sugar O-acetyltransferase [Clostridium mobile]